MRERLDDRTPTEPEIIYTKTWSYLRKEFVYMRIRCYVNRDRDKTEFISKEEFEYWVKE